MKTENINQYTHLYLGLTRHELSRRLELGQIDPAILKAQLDQNAYEVKLDALCEQWLQQKSLEQVDKYSTTE